MDFIHFFFLKSPSFPVINKQTRHHGERRAIWLFGASFSSVSPPWRASRFSPSVPPACALNSYNTQLIFLVRLYYTFTNYMPSKYQHSFYPVTSFLCQPWEYIHNSCWITRKITSTIVTESNLCVEKKASENNTLSLFFLKMHCEMLKNAFFGVPPASVNG